MTRSALILAAATLAIGAMGTTAQAQERHHRVIRTAPVAPPLTVQRRSWLDSGNVVAVGTNNSYLAAATTLNQPVYAGYAPAKFGNSTLPDQYSLAFSPNNPRGPGASGIFDDIEP